MSSLKDRLNKEREANPTEKVVLGITGNAPKKEKYPVNVVFDGKDEAVIRKAAETMGVGVATFIKIAVRKEISAMGLDQE